MQQVMIRIQGCLDPQWAEWFEGFELDSTKPDETLITGNVVDQAALYGLIGKLRDLGVQLLSINFEEKILP